MVPLRTDAEITAALDEIPLLSEEEDDFMSGAGSMADITTMLEEELPNGKRSACKQYWEFKTTGTGTGAKT